MKTSANGYAFIKREEGLLLKAKPDLNKMVIGWGHDLLPGEWFPQGIDEAKAEALLQSDVRKVEVVLDKLFPPSGTQNQYDALIDFGFNLGVLPLHTLFSHPFLDFKNQIPRWCYEHVGGKAVKSEALLGRRKREVELFLA